MKASRESATMEAETETKNEFLQEPFLDGLKDVYNAEKQLVRAIPKLAKAATSPTLKQGLLDHLKETQGHVTRLEEVFKTIGEEPKGKTCEAMKGLVAEGDEATEEEEGNARDAAIIAAAQKVEHYEIATYGTLKIWAMHLANTEAAELLEETLNEEKAADQKLTEEAEKEYAEEESEGDSDEETEEDEGEGDEE